MGEEAFASWGWRLPFFASAVLLLVCRCGSACSSMKARSIQKMKAEGATSKAPLTEAFGNWKNLRLVLVALLGAVAGQAVVWYTGQFYALFYLEKILKVEGATANHADRRRAADRDAVLRLLRLAVRQDRAQADHPGRLRAGRAALFSAVQRADCGGQSGAGRSPGPRAGGGLCRSGELLVPVRSDRQEAGSTRPAATSPNRPWPRPAFPMQAQHRGAGEVTIGDDQSIAVGEHGDLWRSAERRRLPRPAIPPRPIRRRSTRRWWWRSCSCSCCW